MIPTGQRSSAWPCSSHSPADVTGRTPAEAVNSFLDSLQSIVSCVSTTPLTVRGGYHPAADPPVMTLGVGDAVPLRGESRIALALTQHYRIIEDSSASRPWRIVVVAYYYALESQSGQEIIAYHWHPNTRSAVTFPHLHLGPAAAVGRSELVKGHLPTAFIEVGDIVRLTITAFSVEPHRDDWETVIEQSPMTRPA